MKKYIAAKPVRFDRDYIIGEEIPYPVIDPKMLKRLTDAGKVSVITVQETEIEPPNIIKSGVFEQSVIDIETILGIESDETLGFEERMKICITFIQQTRKIIDEFEKASEESSGENNGGEEKSLEETDTDKPPADESGTPESSDSGEENNGGGLPNVTCPVCMRIMGSKSALTLHIKREHPDNN